MSIRVQLTDAVRRDGKGWGGKPGGKVGVLLDTPRHSCVWHGEAFECPAQGSCDTKLKRRNAGGRREVKKTAGRAQGGGGREQTVKERGNIDLPPSPPWEEGRRVMAAGLGPRFPALAKAH